MRCAWCYGSGRVYTRSQYGDPCPRCEPESHAAKGVPCCRICGGEMFTIPGQRSNLGWLCQRCDPRDRRKHREVARVALQDQPIDWTRPVPGWVLFPARPT